MYIYKIQDALQNAGYSPGPLDNIEGPLTRNAISRFQLDHDLEPDGLVGPLTHQALFSNPVARSNISNPETPAYLTRYFKRDEFKCDCLNAYCNGFPHEMDPILLERLDATRAALGNPIIVTSGIRCPTRNQEVGGIPHSKHLIGEAADCYAPGLSIYALSEAAITQGLGVILYESQGFCHLEI
jgi:hypothetical protein